MKRLDRAAFLTTGAATLLASCGHGGVGSSLLPSTSSSAQSMQRAAGTVTPASAIPAYVLSYPIIGEARQFDGHVAPVGWIPLDGRTIATSYNRTLAEIVDNVHAAHSTTFAVPKVDGWIMAVSGTAPTSPHVFQVLHRGANPNHGVSIPGETVTDAPAEPPKRPNPEPTVATWYPGTLPTPKQLEELQHTTH